MHSQDLPAWRIREIKEEERKARLSNRPHHHCPTCHDIFTHDAVFCSDKCKDNYKKDTQ